MGDGCIERNTYNQKNKNKKNKKSDNDDIISNIDIIPVL